MKESLDRFDELICEQEGVETSAKIRARELANVIAKQVIDELQSTLDHFVFREVTPSDLDKVYNEVGIFDPHDRSVSFIINPGVYKEIFGEEPPLST